ncbi:hypothetical protein [Streptomyces flavofungini]|uniref:Secreted protein n=1 Tax=Streptomyces flavofungini TaxID=68200 RepID=A0ABS0X6G4_9ACTN|nr:hypothetical protein [Streptomyces flavofungini]MBJ3808792.1 hypothetical protein [Streptomyces flavofungini]GHC49294.1 hypothetical protein GCM10010349_13480 [Streptomyces flavofungini]
MPDMSGSASLAVTHLVPLAKEVDENKVTPGVLGFIVFAVMALAVWRLMKSMNRHMGKVDFKESPDSTDSTDSTGADASGAAENTEPASAGAAGAPGKSGAAAKGSKEA